MGIDSTALYIGEDGGITGFRTNKEYKLHIHIKNDLLWATYGPLCRPYTTVQALLQEWQFKYGFWLDVENGIDDDINPAFDCSECGAMCHREYNYCPCCGAKMYTNS